MARQRSEPINANKIGASLSQWSIFSFLIFCGRQGAGGQEH